MAQCVKFPNSFWISPYMYCTSTFPLMYVFQSIGIMVLYLQVSVVPSPGWSSQSKSTRSLPPTHVSHLCTYKPLWPLVLTLCMCHTTVGAVRPLYHFNSALQWSTGSELLRSPLHSACPQLPGEVVFCSAQETERWPEWTGPDQLCLGKQHWYIVSSVGTFSVTALCRSLQCFSWIGSHYNVLAYSRHIQCNIYSCSIYIRTYRCIGVLV